MDITHFTPTISSCVSPDKGRIVFAARDIFEGEEIALEPASAIIKRHFDSIDSLKQQLEHVADPNNYLQHCCPVGSTGGLCEQSTEHFNAFFSHSSSPNLTQHCDRFTSREVSITANVNIKKGQELTVDYDSSVGYERHGQEPAVRDFLALCAAHGVEKRPSRLTLPALQIRISPFPTLPEGVLEAIMQHIPPTHCSGAAFRCCRAMTAVSSHQENHPY